METATETETIPARGKTKGPITTIQLSMATKRKLEQLREEMGGDETYEQLLRILLSRKADSGSDELSEVLERLDQVEAQLAELLSHPTSGSLFRLSDAERGVDGTAGKVYGESLWGDKKVHRGAFVIPPGEQDNAANHLTEHAGTLDEDVVEMIHAEERDKARKGKKGKKDDE